MQLNLPDMDDSRDTLEEWSDTARANPIPAALVAIVVGYLGLSVGAPSIVVTALLGIGYGAIPSYLVGRAVVSKTFPDTRQLVLELNLSDESDSITAMAWRIPSDVWTDRVRGDRPALYPESGAYAIVSELETMPELGQIRVEGCNEELANPVSLVARDQKLKEIESNLIEKGEQLDKLEASFRSKVLEIQRENVHSLLAAVETGTQMDPGAVERAVEGVDLDLDVSSNPRHEEESRESSSDQDPSPTPGSVESVREQSTLVGDGGGWDK